MTIVPEPEIVDGQRCFADAQAVFAGPVTDRLPGVTEVGWHDISAHPLRGSFAVISRDSGLDDLIGEILRIETPSRAVIFVYCVASADVPTPISVARRAALGLSVLAIQSHNCVVEIVG